MASSTVTCKYTPAEHTAIWAFMYPGHYISRRWRQLTKYDWGVVPKDLCFAAIPSESLLPLIIPLNKKALYLPIPLMNVIF